MKNKYPLWFIPGYKPKFNEFPPRKEVTRFEVMDTIKHEGSYNDDTIYPEPGFIYKISNDSDGEDHWLIIQKGREIKEENPKYEVELAQYNLRKKKAEEKLAEWKKYKKLHDQDKIEEQEALERETLRRLKLKYEKTI